MRKPCVIDGAVRAHRIRILPTAAQERAFYGFAKVARWAWNTVLRAHNEQVATWQATGKVGDAPTISSLKAAFNAGRPVFAAWTSQMGHRDCWSEPFNDLQKAFAAKRAGVAKHPRLKHFNDSPAFYIANDKVGLDGMRVRLPKVGAVRMTEALRLKGKVRCARVTRDGAGRWFISIQLAGIMCTPAAGLEALGVDVGVSNTITLSTGEVFRAPRTTKREQQKMRRLQRAVSRKYEARKAKRTAVKKAGGDARAIRASKREEAARRKVGKLHAKIADRRNDWQHKVTTSIVQRSAAIGLETLSIQGMLRSRRRGQAKALSDIGLGEIHRRIRYKAGARVENFARNYPSSQLCSRCGARQKMPPGTRTYDCPHCGLHLDRDVNASLNLIPSAWRGSRGTGGSQNAEEQAARRQLLAQPVSAESVKSKRGAHAFT